MSLISRIVGPFSAVFLLAVLLISSLLVNIVQIIVNITALFGVSRRSRLSVNQYLATLWWELFVYWLQLWSGTQVRWTGTPLGLNENAILIGNHGGGLDFVPGIIVATQSQVGCGHMMAMLKKSLQCLPAIGFMHYFQGSLFMSRNWEKDEKHLTKKLTAIATSEYPKPTWVGLYPEGTRITHAKKLDGWAFAEKAGLPKLEHVLIPRTKGFTFSYLALSSSINIVYDVTIAYEGGPIMAQHAFLEGGFRTKAVHLHMRRYQRSELPTTEAELKKWLIQIFVEKDALLAHFYKNGVFPGDRNINPPNVPRLLTLYNFWSVLCIVVLVAILHPSSTVVATLFALQLYGSLRGFWNAGVF